MIRKGWQHCVMSSLSDVKYRKARAVKIACPRRLCQPCGQLKTNIWAYTRTTRFYLPLKS